MRDAWQEKNIVLVGMMGSGKTTIGRRLAQVLGLTFVDADEELERWTGREIREIFATDGEDTFRRLETDTVARLAGKAGQVIATGGGVVLRSENIQVLQEQGWIIFLHADPHVLCARLQGDQTRPLLQGIDLQARIDQLLGQRLALYRQVADWEIDTGQYEMDELVQVIVSQIEQGF